MEPWVSLRVKARRDRADARSAGSEDKVTDIGRQAVSPKRKLTPEQKEWRSTSHEFQSWHPRLECDLCGLHAAYPIHDMRWVTSPWLDVDGAPILRGAKVEIVGDTTREKGVPNRARFGQVVGFGVVRVQLHLDGWDFSWYADHAAHACRPEDLRVVAT